MTTPFIMDEETKHKLDKLRKLAEEEERILSLEELKRYATNFNEDKPSVLGSPFPLDQTLVLPLGWKVTMSFEHQPFGLARHMSMSSPAKGKVPITHSVQWVMLALGFVRPLEGCLVYFETYAAGRKAVNVMEPVDPTVEWPPPKQRKAK